MENDAPFAMRSCPFCGSAKRHLLFDLEAEDFCSVNWSYSKDYRKLLNLPEVARFPIDRCTNCGFVYSRLLPSLEFLSTVYENVILPEFRKGSENPGSYARRMRYVADLMELAPQRDCLKALDFGCGLGVTLRMLEAARIDGVGFDTSPMRVNYVADNGYPATIDEHELRRCAPFEILICDNILEHVSHPMETLGLLSSLSVSNAVLYVSVPNYENKFIQKQIDALQKGLPLDMTLNPWEHLNYFSIHHLEQMLRRVSFEPVKSWELPGHVNIGLRGECKPFSRFKNSVASALRLIRYAFFGKSLQNVNHRFYRFQGKSVSEKSRVVSVVVESFGNISHIKGLSL